MSTPGVDVEGTLLGPNTGTLGPLLALKLTAGILPNTLTSLPMVVERTR